MIDNIHSLEELIEVFEDMINEERGSFNIPKCIYLLAVEIKKIKERSGDEK